MRGELLTYRLAGVLTHTRLHIFQLAVHGVQDALKIQRTSVVWIRIRSDRHHFWRIRMGI
jgi:hypothetical protein